MSLHKILLFTLLLLPACAGVDPAPAMADQGVITCPDEGCGNGSDNNYQSYLDSLPTVTLRYQQQALQIVAQVYGVPASYIYSVHFVPRPTILLGLDGHGVGGEAYLSTVWISWTGAQWTSGASADGPAISGTDFAYEVGRVVYSPVNPPSSVVGQANAALRSAGL